MMLSIFFRVDASLEMGIGHVMRCLTLADALRSKGAESQFICREHEGNLIQTIRNKGYVVHILPVIQLAGPTGAALYTSTDDLSHSHWLGSTQMQDAEACTQFLATQRPDWLIVDHYALDARWERALAPYYCKLMVVDDLADRLHTCDLLLDQTFGREIADYYPLVPENCCLLCGSKYALLRPEFAALRPYSLQRRSSPDLRKLLITMGGVDKDNVTGQVLEALRTCPLPAVSRITVVMGATAPWLQEVRNQAQGMPLPTRVLEAVSDMAQLMADSDLAIGAAGATSWERCCLGLPSIMLVLADNQLKVAQTLEKAGAALIVSSTRMEIHFAALIATLTSNRKKLCNMSKSAADIVDGMGTNSVYPLLVA